MRVLRRGQGGHTPGHEGLEHGDPGGCSALTLTTRPESRSVPKATSNRTTCTGVREGESRGELLWDGRQQEMRQRGGACQQSAHVPGAAAGH